MMVAGGLTPVIANAVSEDQGTGYFVAALIFGLIAAPAMMLAGFGTREHVQVDDERPSIAEMWNGLKVNKPLRLIVVSNILGALTLGLMSELSFFAEYNLGDDQPAGGLFVAMLGVVVGVALTPKATRRMGKIRLVARTGVARAGLLGALFMVGWGNVTIVMAFVVTLDVLSGPFTIHLSTMIGDSVDYTELETGARHEGVALSFQTLMA